MLCVKNVGEECGKQEQNLVTVWVYIGVANEKNDAVGYIPYNLLCSFFFKVYSIVLAGVAQWIECRPVNQRVAGSIPSQGTCLGYRPNPQLRAHKRQPHTDVSLPLFLPPFPSLMK